jgi:3-phosphoshikimate 1-carboxyvinyltransferase
MKPSASLRSTHPGAGRYPQAVRIDPGDRPVGGTIRLPGSKSITNRAILIAGLASGTSVLENALFCDDSHHLAEALLKLGVLVRMDERGARFTVTGVGGPFPIKQGEFYLGNSGTATRFLTAALCLSGGQYTVDGDARMRERPIADLVRALQTLGAAIEAPSGCPPVHLGRSPASGRPGGAPGLEGGQVTVPGRISSQFISALLLAAPLARRDVEVLVEGLCVSRPYIDVTLEVMRRFGAEARADDQRADGRSSFRVRAGRIYRGRQYRIEGDASTASYFLAAAAISEGQVRVEGLGKESIQGDARFADVLARMGAHVKKDSEAIGLAGAPLRGIDEDCSDIPDVVPTLAVVALFARGRTRIKNVAHLRFKESDRISSVASELRKLGGKVRELPDGLEIEESRLSAGAVDSWGDHRIAMAASLVGLRVPGVVVRDPGVVAKSFPGFFEELERIGARVTALGPAQSAPGAGEAPPGGREQGKSG